MLPHCGHELVLRHLNLDRRFTMALTQFMWRNIAKKLLSYIVLLVVHSMLPSMLLVHALFNNQISTMSLFEDLIIVGLGAL